MSKIPDAVFKYIEHELYNLEETKQELKELKNDISSSSIGEMEYNDMPSGQSNENYSSTEATALDMITNKAIVRATKTIRDIEAAKQRLNEDKIRLFNLKYNQCKTWQEITRELCISEATYFRWRKDIIRIVAEKMGLIS